MIDSVRKTPLNTLQIQKKSPAAATSYPTLPVVLIRWPAIAAPKAHFQSTPWLGRFPLICVSDAGSFTLVQLTPFCDATGSC